MMALDLENALINTGLKISLIFAEMGLENTLPGLIPSVTMYPGSPLLSGLVSSPDTKSFTCALWPCRKIESGHVRMVKLGRNHTSISACCHTNQIAQVE